MRPALIGLLTGGLAGAVVGGVFGWVIRDPSCHSIWCSNLGSGMWFVYVLGGAIILAIVAAILYFLGRKLAGPVALACVAFVPVAVLVERVVVDLA